MKRLTTFALVTAMAIIATSATCSPTTSAGDVSEQRAIEIARPHATFAVTSTTAEATTVDGRSVWRVTLRGAPYGADLPGLYPSVVVIIDRRTGEIVSIARP